MPIVSMFYGIIIAMYFADNKRHKAPHIHVKYQDYEAVYTIPDGTILEGDLPKGKARLVEAWIELHRDELMADWALASQGQPIFKIEPLR